MYFKEKKERPQEKKIRTLIANGFHKDVSIQDFPLCGKTVSRHIKCRRWLDKPSKAVLQRDWNLVAQRTLMTVEFAAF